jgi:hypothetical protein
MMRSKAVSFLLFIFAFLVVATAVSLIDAAAQTGAGRWDYFKFKPGQYFKYQMKSARGLSGWASFKIDDGGNGVLNVTLAGKWTKDFSEVVKLKPGMQAFNFINSAKDIEITNAMSSLVSVDFPVENLALKEGFKWAQGDQSMEVAGQKEYAGIKGFMVTYNSKSFGRAQKRTYCISPNVPLPIFVEVPAANDTWTYELVEKRGI